MLGLGRDLARALGVERTAVLTRTEGGWAVRAPGVALVVLHDRVLLVHRTRSSRELRRVQDHVARRLGHAFPIEAMRAVAARSAAAPEGEPPGPAESEVGRIVPDPVDPAQCRKGEDQYPAPSAHDDEDFGSGF